MAQNGKPRTYILRYHEDLKKIEEKYILSIYEKFNSSAMFPSDAGKIELDRIVSSSIPILVKKVMGRGHKFDSEDIISTIPAAIGTRYYFNSPLDSNKLQKFKDRFERLSL